MPTAPTHSNFEVPISPVVASFVRLHNTIEEALTAGERVGHDQLEIACAWAEAVAELDKIAALPWGDLCKEEIEIRLAICRKKKDEYLQQYSTLRPYSRRREFYDEHLPTLDAHEAVLKRWLRLKPTFPRSFEAVDTYKNRRRVFFVRWLPAFYPESKNSARNTVVS